MATFSEAFTRMRENFDQAHENRLNLIRDIRADVTEKAAQTASQLAQQAQQRQAEFAALMHDLRGKLHQQARQTRQQLADLSADLEQAGNVFAGH